MTCTAQHWLLLLTEQQLCQLSTGLDERARGLGTAPGATLRGVSLGQSLQAPFPSSVAYYLPGGHRPFRMGLKPTWGSTEAPPFMGDEVRAGCGNNQTRPLASENHRVDGLQTPKCHKLKSPTGPQPRGTVLSCSHLPAGQGRQPLQPLRAQLRPRDAQAQGPELPS